MNHTFSFFTSFYSAALELCRFVVVPPLLRMKMSEAWNIRERLDLPPLINKNTGRTVVWVHAASLGESKLLVKFLDILVLHHFFARIFHDETTQFKDVSKPRQ